MRIFNVPLISAGIIMRPVGVDAYIDPRADVGIRPYNNFTNYAVSICKLAEIIPQYLHFKIAVI